MNWYRLQQVSTYTTVDPPIDEFIDDGFQSDWSAGEFAAFLVYCDSPERASELAHEEQTGSSVNIYGQAVHHAPLTATEPIEVAGYESPPHGEEELVIEAFSALQNGASDTDWKQEFLKGPLTQPPARAPMIDPIVFYEHKARFDEIMKSRGLPALED